MFPAHMTCMPPAVMLADGDDRQGGRNGSRRTSWETGAAGNTAGGGGNGSGPSPPKRHKANAPGGSACGGHGGRGGGGNNGGNGNGGQPRQRVSEEGWAAKAKDILEQARGQQLAKLGYINSTTAAWHCGR